MELLLFLYLQPILCKLDLKNDFFDISKFSYPIIFHAPSCYLGNLCLCSHPWFYFRLDTSRGQRTQQTTQWAIYASTYYEKTRDLKEFNGNNAS